MVWDVDFTFSDEWPIAGGGTAKMGFGDHVLCTKYASEGDSGALVLNRGRRALGLHIGGSECTSVFCKIHHVLAQLQCDLVTNYI